MTMRLPRKHIEEGIDSWRDDIACRWSAWKTLKCGKWTGHRWGKWVVGGYFWDHDQRYMNRRCSLCRCVESQRIGTTHGTAASNVTVTWK